MTEPGIGHNGATSAESKRKLRSFVSRIDALMGERKSLSDDIRSVYDEAKESGFLPAAIRHCFGMMRVRQARRERLENAIDSYQLALGLLHPHHPNAVPDRVG